MQSESPFNSIPPVIVIIVLAIAGIEAVLTLAEMGIAGGGDAIGWRIAALDKYAYSPAVLDWIVARGDMSFGMLRRFMTYAFIHGSFVHALFAIVILLALGKFVGDAWNPVSLILVLLASTIFAAFAHGLLDTRNTPLYGAYPTIYGLIGAYTYVMWLRFKREGKNKWWAFRLIGVLLAVQLFFGVTLGGAPHWMADVSGFVIGLGLSPILGPGDWTGFLVRMRHRSN